MSKEIISIKVILQRFIEVTLKQTIFRMKRIYTFFSSLSWQLGYSDN